MWIQTIREGKKMSCDNALKRLKMLSLTAVLCLSAVFLSSCGSSDSSQVPVQTTSAADNVSSSTRTVTTAAEQAETDEITGSEDTGSTVSKTTTKKQTSVSTSTKKTSGTSAEATEQPVNTDATGGFGTSGGTTTSTSAASSSASQTSSSSSSSHSSTLPHTPFPENSIDSRQYLIGLMKDKKLGAAARTVMEGMQQEKNEIRIEDRVLKESQLGSFIGLVSMLEAESYIIPSPYAYTVNKSGYVTGIKVSRYPKTVAQYQAEKNAVDRLANELAAYAEENCATQFDKVLFFHDYIINNCTYDIDAPNGASAYGCLIEGRAVCEGYAKAMQVLCSRAGIECVPVTGRAAYEGNSQSHMWNLINIDGCWTHVDATWDDIESNSEGAVEINAVCYSYFGLTDKEIHFDHIVTENPLISIPQAVSNSSSYFVRGGYYITSEERIKEVLRKAVEDAVQSSSRTVTVRCADERLYEQTKAISASGEYEYEFMLELIKEAKAKFGTDVNATEGFLIGDCPNARGTHTIMIFLKYDE